MVACSRGYATATTQAELMVALGVGASALLFPNDRPARDPPTQGLLERLRFSGSGLRPAEFAVSARGCVDESNPIDRNSPAIDISRRTRT